MRKVWSRWMMVLVAALAIWLSDTTAGYAQGNVSVQVFYDELQPYGTWMDHGQYGYVWMPNVDQGFVPYGSNGYWVNTSYGNTWVSDYSWGWAPFHYGRWFYDDFYGWLWMPDSVWAPAWVAWRSGGGYYGWAPLMPGFGINVSVGYYNRIPQHYWNFVPYRYVMYRHVYTHCVPRPQIVNVIHHTTVVTHNYNNGRDRSYFTGPTRSEVERRNHERVPVYEVSDRGRPGRTEVGRNSVNIYKPEIDNSPSVRSRAIPSKVYRSERDASINRESRREAPTMENSLRERQGVRREVPSTDANQMDGAMPAERNSNLNRTRETDRSNFQREQNAEQLNRQQNVERMQREQSVEKLQRQQNTDRFQQQRNADALRQREPNNERLQRQQSIESQPRREIPSRGFEQPARENAPVQQQRQFNPVQPRQQQERPATNPGNNRSTQPQVERQQQVQRAPARSQSTQPARRESSPRRGID